MYIYFIINSSSFFNINLFLFSSIIIYYLIDKAFQKNFKFISNLKIELTKFIQNNSKIYNRTCPSFLTVLFCFIFIFDLGHSVIFYTIKICNFRFRIRFKKVNKHYFIFLCSTVYFYYLKIVHLIFLIVSWVNIVVKQMCFYV